MSESPEAAKPTQEKRSGLMPIRLLGQYIKDLSFEVPQGASVFELLRTQAPEIPVSLDVGMTHQADSTYEVVLSAHAEAVVAGKTVFILEVQYGALVELNEQLIGQEHIHPVLLIEIPRQMFPFVRQIVADLTVSGGFPPLFLQLIDFAELYRAKYGVPGRPVNGDGEAPTIN